MDFAKFKVNLTVATVHPLMMTFTGLFHSSLRSYSVSSFFILHALNTFKIMFESFVTIIFNFPPS